MKKSLPLAGDSTPNNPLPDLQSPEHRKLKKLPTRKEQQRRAAESGVSGRDVYEEDEDMTDTMTKAKAPQVDDRAKKEAVYGKHLVSPGQSAYAKFGRYVQAEKARKNRVARTGDIGLRRSMDEMLADRIAKGGFLNEQSRFDAPVMDRDAWKGKVLNLVGEAVAKAEAAIIEDRKPQCGAHGFGGSGGIQHAPLNMVCTCDAPVRKGAIAERAASYLSKVDAESLRVARELGLPLDASWIASVLDGGDDLELSAEEPDLVKAGARLTWKPRIYGGAAATDGGSYQIMKQKGSHTLSFNDHAKRNGGDASFKKKFKTHEAARSHAEKHYSSKG